MMGGWGSHWGMRGPGMLLGGLGMLLLWVVIIGLVVWLVVRLIRSTSSKPVQSTQAPQLTQTTQPDPVLEILRRRLAAGEITSQDYDELRQKLGV